MPQLDGLRALAVVAVAVSHWTPEFLIGIMPWGTGVQLFFVLSGFLITGILLRNRPGDLGITMSAALKVFYTRRILRIFPLYYGVLGFSLLFGVGPIYSTWPWHVSYLSNIYYAWHGHPDAVTDPFLHLWSLSVEEQFYFLWPLIALVAPRRALLVILYSSIVGSVVFRMSITQVLPAITTIRYLTPSCLDALGIGALIAYVKHYKGSLGVRQIGRRFAWVGVLGLVLSTVALPRLIGSEQAHRVGHTFLVVVYGAVVAQAAEGFGSLPGWLLNLGPVRYLGKISYGIYVYHYFAPAAMAAFATRFGLEAAFQQQTIALPAYAAFTLVVAILSWHLYELPINRLKRHFEYPRATVPNPPLMPPVGSPVSRT